MKTPIRNLRKNAGKLLFLLTVIFAKIAVAQPTGYFQDFNSGSAVPSNISGGSTYTTSMANQSLNVKINKGDFWSGLFFSMPAPLNLSLTSNRKVSFKIKTDTLTRPLPYEIQVFTFGVTGQDGGKRTRIMIYPTSKWQTVSFDFNDPASTSVNYTSITGVQIVAQPLNVMDGTIQIDDFAVGDNGIAGQAAVAAPYFLGFPNQDIYINNTKTLKINNAIDANSLSNQITFNAVSSNPSILPNPTFANSPFLSNNYFRFTSGNGSPGDLLSSRPVIMNLNPVANQFGMVTVTVTASVPVVTTALGTTTILGVFDTFTGTGTYTITPSNVTTPVTGSPAGESIANFADGNNGNKWLTFVTSGSAVLEYAQPRLFNSYIMVSGDDSPDRDPKSWTLHGSNTNNGNDWVLLDTQADGNLPEQRRTAAPAYNFTNSTAYSFFRWSFISVKNNSQGLMQICDFKMGFNTPTGTTTGILTVNTVVSVIGTTTSPYSYIFTTNVKRNEAPTIGVIPTSFVGGSNRAIDFNLDKIFSGNGEIKQNMTITGTSSDQAVVGNSNIIVTYDGVGTTAKVKITPVQFASLPTKTANITFTITDNGATALGGLNQTSYMIPLTVYPTYFNSPKFDLIANQVDNLINQGQRILTITGISDGNNASRISSIVATSSNTSILANPIINYSTGQNYATLSYNSQIVGSVQVSVTATNFGAPSNSNGNTSFTRVFTIEALAPPISGYIEPFASSTAWDITNSGTVQNFSINTTTKVATLIQDKPGTAPAYFSGIAYTPNNGLNLYDFKANPYLSITLSTTNTLGKVAIDLWDVNGIRYGLSSNQAITGTPTTYTFCYNGTPCSGGLYGCGINSTDFDFSKIKYILFNFGVTPYYEGTGRWDPYQGTYTISNLRLGKDAEGFGSCPPNVSNVLIGNIINPFHLSTQTGPKTVTITGVSAGSNPIAGKNLNPLNLVVSGGLNASLISYNPSTEVAVVGYTSTATVGLNTITLTGSATNAVTLRKTFTVKIQDVPAAVNLVINNDLSALMPDGQKGQTIDGSPFGVCEILLNNVDGNNLGNDYYQRFRDVNLQSMRIGVGDFEPINDNSDPNVLDKSKLDYEAMHVDFFKKASDAGVKRFLVTFFSPPSFVKYNNSQAVPAPPAGYIITNTVDSAYYDEYAEYAVAFVQGVKEKAGVDIWGIAIGNEIQFNQSYNSVVLNTAQYVEIIRKIGRRFKAEDIKTFLWGPETLQAQDAANAYMKACQADPEVKNYLAGYAVHSYAADGVGAGGPSTGNWSNILVDSRDTRSNEGLTAVRNSLIPTIGPGGEPHQGNGGTGIPVHMTETSQGGLATFASWQNAMDVYGAVISSLNFGNVSGWYYIGLPAPKEADFYYTYKHVNKFVFGGARRMPSTSPTGTSSSSFRNPDGSLTILIGNDDTQARLISLTGVNIPTAFKAYLSTDNNFWQDLGTISGSVLMPPNSLITLWGDGNALVAANGITVSGANGASSIDAAGGTLQMAATVAPANLNDKSVTWSITTITGNAILNANGLLTAKSDGTVAVRATSNATPSVFGELIVTITGQINISLTGITLTALGNTMSEISLAGGFIEFLPIFNPTSTTSKSLNWTLTQNQPMATLSQNGFLRASDNGNGIVTVTATSLSNASISASAIVTISGQALTLEGLTISGASSITANAGSFNINAAFAPIGTTKTNLVFSISPSGVALVSSVGLVTAVDNGVVTITATSFTSPSIFSKMVVTISGQYAKSLTILGNGGINNLNTIAGTLQMVALTAPANVLSQNVIWKIVGQQQSNAVYNGKDMATINSVTGMLSSLNYGNGLLTISGFLPTSSLTSFVIINVSNQRNPVVQIRSLSMLIITSPGHVISASGITDPPTSTDKSIKWKALSNINFVNVNSLTGVISSTDLGNAVVTIGGFSTSDPSVFTTVIATITGQSNGIDYELTDNTGNPTTAVLGNTKREFSISSKFMPIYNLQINRDVIVRSNFVNYTVVPTTEVTVNDNGDVALIGNLFSGATITGVYSNNPSLNFNVIVRPDTVTGINKTTKDESNSYSFYPVPFDNQLQIEGVKLGDKIEIYNSLAALITSFVANASNVSINTGDFVNGLYHVVVTSNGKSNSTTVMKQQFK